MNIEYRSTDYEEADYEAVVRIAKALRPDDFTSVEDLREWDDLQRNARRYSVRWLAVADGETVGWAYVGESPWRGADNPSGDIAVHSTHQHRGIGRGLLERIEATAAERGASKLRLSTHDNRPRAIRFLEAAGYAEIDREWRSTLDLTSFDPGDWSDVVDRVAASGVDIASVAEVRDAVPDWIDRLYALYSAVEGDVPEAEPIQPLKRGDWETLTLGRNMLADGFLLAIEDGSFIGLTEPQRVDGDDRVIAQELTGVARDARGRGVATALKVAAAVWAKEAGYTSIRTYNAQRNGPMLAVNDKIGFERDYAIIEYRKHL